MKIKLSKIMAAVTALGVTFAGFTALAADVAITTSYDYAGSSDVTVNFQTVDPDERNNYNIPSLNTSWSIAKRTLTIIAKNQTIKNYGEKTFKN